jgi:hypothetical protein
MKELFWKDDEVCYQLHPTKDNYINNDEHCLHLWKPIDEEIPLPPPILVGFRKGHEEDKAILKQVQEELGNPMTDEEIDFMYQVSFNNKEEIEKIIEGLSLEQAVNLLINGRFNK